MGNPSKSTADQTENKGGYLKKEDWSSLTAERYKKNICKLEEATQLREGVRGFVLKDPL